MAGFFQAFRTSTMPKRLLRYALSRLDLLDAEALDMENLDFALGRNTVLEFRDVGIILPKLEKILKLPATFSLQKAKVLLLRVTIPVDFYASPITVEVDGVDVRLKVASKEVKSEQPRKKRKNKEDPDAVPTAADLAQSFLETQPSSEKKQLEEALVAETQDLGASVAMSDSGSEEDFSYGTGQALSLPAFLTDFLQGVVDRTQIRIRGVTFQLDLEVPVDAQASVPELVTFQLALEEVSVEGVTAPAQGENGAPKFIHKEGKRHISLGHIRAFLITEANVFSSLARSPSMPSSLASQSPVMTEARPFSHQPTALDASIVLEPLLDPEDLTQSQYPLQDSEDAFNIPYELDEANEEEAFTAEDIEAAEEEQASPLSTPRASVYQDFSSPPRDRQARSTVMGPESVRWAPPPPPLLLEPETDVEPAFVVEPRIDIIPPRTPSPLSSSRSSVASDGSARPVGEDLTESHLYSHEDAESMYMSAFSQAESARMRSSMPGSWEAEEPPSPEASPSLLNTEIQPVASLEQHSMGEGEVPQESQESNALPEVATLPLPVAEQQEVADVNLVESEKLPGSIHGPVGAEHHQSESQQTEQEVSLEQTEQQQQQQQQPEHLDHPDHGEQVEQAEELEKVEELEQAEEHEQVKQSLQVEQQEQLGQEQQEKQETEQLEQSEQSEQSEQQEQQEDIPTPRGPTRLVKEILSLQSVSVYVPLLHKHIKVVPPPDLAKSSPHLPGAFSVYSAAPTSPAFAPVDLEASHQPVDKAIEIILAPIEVRFDASLGFLLAMVVSKLLEALKGQSNSAAASSSSGAATSSAAMPDIRLTMEEISILFLEKLSGVADTPQRIFEKTTAPAQFGPDVLLKASMQNLNASLSQTGSQTDASVRIERFKFGYGNDDILSFDRRVQMFESVMNTFPAAGEDISVHVAMSEDNTRCNIHTLPLHVKLDLQRLDETFGWLGGLSSFLNMGSSITSNASKGPRSPVRTTANNKPRGVRFEVPISPDDQSAAKENKVDLRINGFRLDLIGRECSVALDTSALKLVSREEGVGVHFSRIRLAGPYTRGTRESTPPVMVDILDTRLDYLVTPRDSDLERLLELITPSKVKYDEDKDEIMVDTLLRQRRKGAVLRLSLDKINVKASRVQQLSCLPSLGEDLARLGTVAKYLPEDDRPGLLTLGVVKAIECTVDVGGKLGAVQAALKSLELAHITMPSLVAVAVGSVSVTRNKTEELVGTWTGLGPVLSGPSSGPAGGPASHKSPPALMARMIDDIEPVLKVKMMGVGIEYRVPTVMDILGLAEDATPQDFEASLAASVANLGEQAQTAIKRGGGGPTLPEQQGSSSSKPIKVDVVLRNCLIGLNPLGMPSKLVVVLTDAHLEAIPGKNNTVSAVADLKKASLLLTNDTASLLSANEVSAAVSRRRSSASSSSPQVAELCAKGFVDICQISSAKATLRVARDAEGEQHVDVEVRDDLLVLETCADSTQTLMALANALAPPTPPSKEIKYRTSVVPVQDLLASITADAFGRAEGDYDFDKDFAMAQELDMELELGSAESGSEDDFFGGPGGGGGGGGGGGQGGAGRQGRGDTGSGSSSGPLDLDSHYYEEAVVQEPIFDATASSLLAEGTTARDTSDGVLVTNLSVQDIAAGSDDGDGDGTSTSSDLAIEDNYFGAESVVHGTAHRWNSAKNTYDHSNDSKVHRSPLRVCVRDVHVIWNLFDGYDWARTRDVISKAVQDVEAKAYERRARLDHHRRGGGGGGGGAMDPDFDDEDETVVGDFLFNSIYVTIPGNRDPRELAQAINEMNDNATETESVAATSVTGTTAATVRPGSSHHRGGRRSSGRKLKLGRSRHHKITFELQGVNVDLVTFPPGSGETVDSVDVRVRDLDIFDHVPTSTWRKFAMYDQDAGEREMGADMVHLELLNTKPVRSMPASEMVLKVTVLPLRLHVDQDALDFITRFFEFKDDAAAAAAAASSSPSDVPFIQRAEINDIPVKLDFKPKRVDYAGLRSGHTTEFMNFLVLEDARMVLRHIILYGVSGFDRLGRELNDIWMANVKATQLGGILAGLTGVRSLVNAGSGIRDLIEIPIREYRKDGRIVRSIGKGAVAFARTTGTEVVKFGAKLAIGTQYALQGAEGMLAGNSHTIEGGGGSSSASIPGASGTGGGGLGREGGGADAWDYDEDEDEDDAYAVGEQRRREQISLYANQPMGIVQGVRGAYASLARDLSVARDAIIAVPGEVMESTSAGGAARAVLRRAPTIVFRPAIGATRAIGQTLLGATNALDPLNRRRMDAKYKKY